MKEVRLRPQAKRDRVAEVKYYRKVAGAAVAMRLVETTRHTLRQVGDNPEIGSPRLGAELGLSELRVWSLPGFPLVWMYIDAEEYVDVLRLVGERQDILAIISEYLTLGDRGN